MTARRPDYENIMVLGACSYKNERDTDLKENFTQETHTVKFDYTFADCTFPIHFVWSEGDGKLLANKLETEENSEKALRWSVYGDTEFVKIYLYPDGIGAEYYLILYDVYEDELLDVLAGMPSEQKENINDVLLAEDLSSAIIHCNKNEDVYYYNIPKEELKRSKKCQISDVIVRSEAIEGIRGRYAGNV